MKKTPFRLLFALSSVFLAQSLSAQPGPLLDVSPVIVDFGVVAEGGRARQNLTLTNLTDATLDITNFAQTGATSFSIDPIGGGKPCGATTPQLAAGDDCTMEVVFTPEFSESAAGTLTFTPNSDPTKAITVRMKGETPEQGGGCSLRPARKRP